MFTLQQNERAKEIEEFETTVVCLRLRLQSAFKNQAESIDTHFHYNIMFDLCVYIFFLISSEWTNETVNALPIVNHFCAFFPFFSSTFGHSSMWFFIDFPGDRITQLLVFFTFTKDEWTHSYSVFYLIQDSSLLVEFPDHSSTQNWHNQLGYEI